MDKAATNGAYDVNRIRADFPILATQVYGKPLVYLDNAASAQKPSAVPRPAVSGLHDAICQCASAACTISPTKRPEAYEGAREKVASFLNAKRKEEIIFTRNATEAINLVAYTFGRGRIKTR